MWSVRGKSIRLQRQRFVVTRKKSVLKITSKITSELSVKTCKVLKIRLRHRFFLVNFEKYLKKHLSKISRRLLLDYEIIRHWFYYLLILLFNFSPHYIFLTGVQRVTLNYLCNANAWSYKDRVLFTKTFEVWEK